MEDMGHFLIELGLLIGMLDQEADVGVIHTFGIHTSHVEYVDVRLVHI